MSSMPAGIMYVLLISSACWIVELHKYLLGKWMRRDWAELRVGGGWKWENLHSFSENWVFIMCNIFRSDQISHSVVSDSLRPHESQHTRPPCPSPTPGVHWDSGPSSQWCHPAISSSVIPFLGTYNLAEETVRLAHKYQATVDVLW